MTGTRTHASAGEMILRVTLATFGALVASGLACTPPTVEADDGMSEAHKQCDGYVGRYEACLLATSSNNSLRETRVAELKASLNGAMGGDRNSRVALAKRCEREADKLRRCAGNDGEEVVP